MFDDVLKGSKASKKNKAEDIKPATPETKDPKMITGASHFVTKHECSS